MNERRVSDATDTLPSGRDGLKRALLLLGVLTVAFVVSRRRRSSGAVSSIGEDLPEEDLTKGERSREEIEERAAENVQEEPAEPGEMTVDEDIVENIADEAPEDDERT